MSRAKIEKEGAGVPRAEWVLQTSAYPYSQGSQKWILSGNFITFHVINPKGKERIKRFPLRRITSVEWIKENWGGTLTLVIRPSVWTFVESFLAFRVARIGGFDNLDNKIRSIVFGLSVCDIVQEMVDYIKKRRRMK